MCTTQVREARLPADKPVILEFIMALQRYESFLEPNRLYDIAMAEDYFETLCERVRRGRMFVAEEGGRAVGWTIVYEEETEAFIRPDERHFAYLAELYVVEEARGTGVAYQLIDACETWARQAGYTTMRIDLLARNERAARAYAKAGYTPYCQEVRKRLLPASSEEAEQDHVVPFKGFRARRFPLMAAE